MTVGKVKTNAKTCKKLPTNLINLLIVLLDTSLFFPPLTITYVIDHWKKLSPTPYAGIK